MTDPKPDPGKVKLQQEKAEQHYKDALEVDNPPTFESAHFILCGQPPGRNIHVCRSGPAASVRSPRTRSTRPRRLILNCSSPMSSTSARPMTGRPITRMASWAISWTRSRSMSVHY